MELKYVSIDIKHRTGAVRKNVSPEDWEKLQRTTTGWSIIARNAEIEKPERPVAKVEKPAEIK